MKKILLTTMMLLGISGVAIAGGPRDGDCWKGDGHHGRHHMSMLEKKLDLTDEQKASVQQIRDEYRSQMKSRVTGPDMADFMSLDPEDPAYMDKVREIAEERANAVEQRTLLNAEKHAKIYAILTDEQREKLQQLHEKRKEKFEKRHMKMMEQQ